MARTKHLWSRAGLTAGTTGSVTQDCSVPLVGLIDGNLTTIQGTLADVSNLAPVQPVHTRTGDVVGMAGDYNATLVGFDTAGRSIIQPTFTDVQLAVNDLDDEVAGTNDSGPEQ